MAKKLAKLVARVEALEKALAKLFKTDKPKKKSPRGKTKTKTKRAVAAGKKSPPARKAKSAPAATAAKSFSPQTTPD